MPRTIGYDGETIDHYPTQTTEEQATWVALRTHLAQESKVGRYLDTRHTRYFIPMVMTTVNGRDGKPERKARPAVHNLIFVALEQGLKQVRDILKECPYYAYVYTKPDKPQEWCIIPDSDMIDLRLICDLSFNEPKFVAAEECELKVGHTVRVTHGPLKNITGKLIRKNKKYYLVRTFGDLGVMVSVSRWCCEAVEEP